MNSAEEVVLSQVDPWNSGDIETAMALYTDDASVKIAPAIPPGSPNQHNGKDELRAWFVELVEMDFEIDLEVVEVNGDTVTTRTKTWVDPTRQLGVVPLVATEVYTVEDGRIAGWTWTLTDESLGALESATAAAQEAPIVNVTFDGEQCIYDGPPTMSAAADVTFEFAPSVEPDRVALVVGLLKDGYTWEEVLESAETDGAGYVPPWAGPGYQIQYGPGSLVVAMEPGTHTVVCDTSPAYTNSRYPAALIEVTET